MVIMAQAHAAVPDVSALPDGMCAVGVDGEITDVDERLLQMTGFTSAELLGTRTPFPFCPPEEAARLTEALDRAQRDGGCIFEITLMRRSGERFPCVARVTPVDDDCGIRVMVAVPRVVSHRDRDRERLRDAQLVARLATWEADLATREVTISPEPLWASGIAVGSRTSVESLLACIGDDLRTSVGHGVEALRAKDTETFIARGTARGHGGDLTLEVRGRAVRGREGELTMVRGTVQDVTEQEETRRAVRRERDFLLATLDSLDAHVAVLDEHGEVLVTNRAWDRFATENGGYGCGTGANYLSVCDAAPEDAVATLVGHEIRAMLAGARGSFSVEYPCHGPVTEHWFALTATLHVGEGPTRVVVQHTDLTERRKAERDAQFQARLLDDVAAGVIATDLAGRVTHFNAAAERLFGWERDEAVGRSIASLRLTDADAGLLASRAADILRCGRTEGEYPARRKDGSTFRAYVRDSVVVDRDDKPEGTVGVFVDISQQAALKEALAEANDYLRTVASSMAEGMCTLDDKGRVHLLNDAGAEILRRRASDCLGTSFCSLVHGERPHTAECPITPGRCTTPVRVDEDAFARGDGGTVPVSYTVAPFETGQGVRGAVVVFSDISERLAEQEHLRRDQESLAWVSRINDALDQDRFVLHAQPIIDLKTGETVQHELLIRLLDEQGKLVPPGLFLPYAEEYGLIRELDRWVVRQASRLAGKGHAVEVNLSAESLSDPSLYDYVARELAAESADPSLVVLELTETALLRNETAARTFIEQVSALGCRLALDDFGTGYGGFTYLKRLPFDYLKIDIEFVRDLVREPASEHVVRAVVDLAARFSQRTVAEGVEDVETLAALRGLGVDLAQGYGIRRPGPVEEVLADRQRAGDASAGPV